jgi:signal transduction histidine kinase
MPHPSAARFASQLSGIEMAAFVLAVLALLHLLIWWRDRTARFAWLAASFLLMATFFATDRLHPATNAYVNRSGWTIEIELALFMMVVGVIECLNVPPPWHYRAVVVLGSPYLVFTALVAAGVPMLRQHHNVMIIFTHVGMAALAFQAAVREPRAGHGLIALALLSIPGMSALLLATGVEAVALRYFVPMPLIVLGLTLLMVTVERRRQVVQAEVLRRQRAEAELLELNASLERQVQERTADLRSMVAGLESFNRTVSHDLRGPLSGMAGLAEMAHAALLRHDDALARQALPAIAQQARESVGLVQALLSLAQVGEARFEAAPTDLASVVQDTIRQLTLTHPDWPVSAVHVHALPTAQADVALLRPVFANLIGNALKFRREDVAPSIDISAQRHAGEIVVQVRDNGRGFDAAHASSLFQPFVRLHRHEVEGHGVGLSIVRRAVERHGGRVWAEARPDEGASFYFSLPA